MDERSRRDKLHDMQVYGTPHERAAAARILERMPTPEAIEESFMLPDGTTVRWHIRVSINGQRHTRTGGPR